VPEKMLVKPKHIKGDCVWGKKIGGGGVKKYLNSPVPTTAKTFDGGGWGETRKVITVEWDVKL